jgi:hypothetical protein
MTIITNLISSKVISNLDTYQYTVKEAGMHYVSLGINEKPPSGITISIQQNSNTPVTTSAPGASQQVVQLATTFNCAVNDTITIVVASSTATDQGPQAFKGILTIKQGSLN